MAQSFAEALGWVPKTRHLAGTFARAHDYARAQAHPTVLLEHLLAALLEDPEAAPVLQASNVALNRLNGDVGAFLGSLPHGDTPDPAVDPALSRILEYAVAAAQQSRRREVNGAIVLAAIVGEGKSQAAAMLKSSGMTFEGAIKALQRSAIPARQPVQEQPAAQHALAPPASQEPLAAASRATEELLAGARMRVRASRPAGGGTSQGEGSPSADTMSALTDAAAAMRAPPPPAPQPAAQQPPPPPQVRTSGAYDAFRDDFVRRDAEPSPEQGWIPPAAPQPTPMAPSARPLRMPPPLAPMPTPQPSMPLPGPPEPQAPRQPAQEPPWADTGPTLDSPAAGRQSRARPREPERGYPESDTTTPPSRRPSRRPGTSNRASAKLEPAELAKSIPRTLRSGAPELVEIRVPKAAIALMAEGAGVTRAMSVRLRAPEGGFTIETASPETQWVDGQLSLLSDDEAGWRWSVTPLAAGAGRLQLVISTRSLSDDGQAIEQAMPDHVVDVRVRRDYASFGRRLFGWIIAAGVGALLARYGETLLDVGVNALRQIASV